ncbi:lamin tail domain-containing protein [Actinoplanes sp. NEAU-A12]|uniref:Lamin tail domain-containing protein n=1 Tax=Actinoplanes sandaracinus TaxID=3045177 RepID=A0ABT6WBP8_9ACTN|nr:lamin tail domain-containing protein [Actinoplanes sandaracinus]MDI6097159.1 lamin tail domain-containing protein [Actinoplanes sandaracinus]
MFRRLTTLATAVTLTLAGLAAPAHAAGAACRAVAGSPHCQVWTGKVDWVPDGDTLRVDLAGDGTRNVVSVRVLGIQAMEQHVYSHYPERRKGDCHALAANARLEQLIKAGGGTVRLTALKASSKSGSRPLRSVAVKIGGQWQDVGEQMVRGGFTLWQAFPGEWAMDEVYHRAAKEAAAAGRGLYDPASCKPGPAQNSGLTVTVNADAEGLDEKNLNGEWFRVHNPSAADVPIGGWWVRDSGLRRYTFPAGTVAPAGGDVYVHIGKGKDTAGHKYWGLTKPIFSNVDPAAHSVGDGGYLFDVHGDLRTWMIYP